MPLAARVTDSHSCPAFTGPVPHIGGPIIPPASPNVQTNSLPQARCTDQAICAGPPDFIVVGSGSVMVNNQMAARLTDPTMHGGLIALSSMNVEIGGPSAGGTLGNPIAGGAACRAAAASRFPQLLGLGPTGNRQSYGNCGVESSRQIINTVFGSNISQEGLLRQTIDTGITDFDSNPNNLGGISADTDWHFFGPRTLSDNPQSKFTDLLKQNGVPASEVPATSKNLQQAVAQNRGVIVILMAGTLWRNPTTSKIPPGTGPHAVLVTGVQYDATGKVKTFFINDTGKGRCSQPVPFLRLLLAIDDYFGGTGTHIVTDAPIW